MAVKVWWRDLQSCWECSSTCYTPIQCQTTTIAAPTWWHTPTWWPNIAWKSAENQDFWPDLRHETCLHVAVKVWSVEGLTIMLGVFMLNLLYTHTMPNNHYCSTYMMAYPHLMAKHCLKVGRKSNFSWSEAWNLPTCGCKSMVEGLTIMLGVFINLLYTHTMPNNHYCSTYMMAYPHLMAKHCLRVGRKSRFLTWSEAWNLPTCGCKSMVGGTYNHAGSVHQLVIHPYNAKQSLLVAPTWWHTPTWWPNIAWKSAENQDFWPDLRHETCLHVAVKVWWRDLQSCWECSSTCYTPIQCQTTTIAAPTWWHTPTWWPNIAWKSSENQRFLTWSEAWNLPTCGCKSMVGEGLTIMLGVFINLLYTHTMPNNHYCSTYMMAYPHLMAKHCLKVGRKSRDFSLIWGMKPAYMWL